MGSVLTKIPDQTPLSTLRTILILRLTSMKTARHTSHLRVTWTSERMKVTLYDNCYNHLFTVSSSPSASVQSPVNTTHKFCPQPLFTCPHIGWSWYRSALPVACCFLKRTAKCCSFSCAFSESDEEMDNVIKRCLRDPRDRPPLPPPVPDRTTKMARDKNNAPSSALGKKIWYFN